jgi:hypothetical protein
MISSGLAFAVFSPLYFVHYALPPRGAFVSLPKMLAYFSHFLGAYIDEGKFNLPVVSGIVILACFIVFFPISRKLRITEYALPLVCILGFLLASMIPVAVFRSNVIEYIPSRYRLYSNLLPALLLVFVLIRLNGKKIRMAVIVIFTALVALVYCRDFDSGVGSFAHLHDILKTVDYYYSDKNDAIKLTKEICQSNIYCIEDHREPKIIF